jgi:hypothetical protein
MPKTTLVLKTKNVVNAIRYLEALEDHVQKAVKSGARASAQTDSSLRPVPLGPGHFGRGCAFDVTRDPGGKVGDTIDGKDVLRALGYMEKVTRRIRTALK